MTSGKGSGGPSDRTPDRAGRPAPEPTLAAAATHTEPTLAASATHAEPTLAASATAATERFAIETKGLTKFYGGRPVVNSLDLRVPEGCVYGFLGRNGAGKSTTIRMLTGMARPDGGTATVLGEPSTALSPAARGRIAYIVEGHPLYGWMSVGQAERFAREFATRWNNDLVGRILDHFEISRGKKIRTLSNGQRAQVSLALAVAPDPELLILDDPTLGLDTVVRRDFLESMIQIIQRRGRTILFSSHILGDVERVADRIGILVDGVLRVDCPTDVFKQSVRKLVLTFDREPPAWPDRAGVVSDAASGRRRELVIVGYGESHRGTAAALGPVDIQEVEMNLEDAFIAYTRPSHRALPSFDPEASPCTTP